jgi:hypothetical protein
MTGSPAVTSKPPLGYIALSENALAVMRWQPVQWHAIVSRGFASIRKRTSPQRHPPSWFWRDIMGSPNRFRSRYQQFANPTA